MPVPENYFKIRVSTKKYKRYFKKVLSKEKGIIGWFGVRGDDGIGPRGGKSAVVEYWFRRSKWSYAQAKAWIKKHNKIEETAMSEEDFTFYEDIPEVQELIEEAKWSTAYVNNLPDSAFAVIESGGKKDDKGKTVPRTLRHLPYKDATGKVDVPHLRNAWARRKHVKPANMSKDAFVKKATAKLRPLLKKYGIQIEETQDLLNADIDELRNVVNSLAAEANRAIETLNDGLKKMELITEIRKVRKQVANIMKEL